MKLLELLLLVTTLAASVSGERDGRCPALKQWGICPMPAIKCVQDEDCPGGVDKCCASACGPTCVKPLYTGCEQLHMEATRRARALGTEGSKVKIPTCNNQGDFDPIQCNPVNSSCWCVDGAGFEIPGTRSPTRELVNCTAPKMCAGHTCRMLCPYGFSLDENGCPKCHCYDPCSEIKCPGVLSCELEDVACVKQPCPPVPRCKRARSLENVCPTGEPLIISDSDRPFLCGISPGKPRCPPLFECLVQRGNDYGVCCPASFKLQKPGSCPSSGTDEECGTSCEHDLECPSMQKCCACSSGKHCSQPQNVTICLQQRMLAELLIMNEREGKGYVPQCSPLTGQFESKQCSRNGLICWCVDSHGNKVPRSMGPKESVKCEMNVAQGRSLSPSCDKNICAQVCEYGFKIDQNGCPTCECDNPCEGFPCSPTEECVAVRDESCSGFLCPTSPQCRPRLENVCKHGTPLMDVENGHVIQCGECPNTHICTYTNSRDYAVCCPKQENTVNEVTKPGSCPIVSLNNCDDAMPCQTDNDCRGNEKCCHSDECGAICMKSEERPPTMCEYLRDFSDKMEGTREGMGLALLAPKCHSNGSFEAKQCDGTQCWCVDSFGTEIPETRTSGPINCAMLREELGCLDLTCRLGCDYGFVLDPTTRCPLCECRNPCNDVRCSNEETCQMVEVNCDDEYCPPVPACLPNKPGQCPYLIPVSGGSCDYECRSDLNCNGTSKCCSNGCGTQCLEPVMLTACQHKRAILEHKAHESGIPANQLFIPKCRDDDGSFEPVQCHPLTRQCWCVDNKGDERPGTRAPPDVQPLCETQSKCPMLDCAPCPYGYQLDKAGCQTCKCQDPCAEISCRGDGETCRLVDVACIDQPCPPVPMCLPRRENPCQTGHPLLMKGSNDIMQCGPNGYPCPSSHKCHLSPLGEYAVCCPKPRDVCFEPPEKGPCDEEVSRWYFNSENNTCQQFTYGGCAGNQNNFDSETVCNGVCPVLSQCERLREKNQKTAEKYKKTTFMPRCDPETGNWESVQCLEEVGVCWCVNRAGEPIKGSLTRDAVPSCNFRQARRRMHEEPDFAIEELLKEVATLNADTPPKTRCQTLQQRMTGTNAMYAVSCDAEGRFSPTQCYPRKSEKFPECWCVDEAGNQLPNTTTFKRGAKICLPTPIKAVEVRLGFQGQHKETNNDKLKTEVKRILEKLGAKLSSNQLEIKMHPDVTYVTFEVVGSNKVDVVFHLEEMVRSHRLAVNVDELEADITRSHFSHRLSDDNTNEVDMSDRIIALEHREIVSQSTVSMVTPYQTAIVVLSVASAFVICILVVVIILYRKKVSSSVGNSLKTNGLAQRFLSQPAPIYVVSLPQKTETSFPRVGLSTSETETTSKT